MTVLIMGPPEKQHSFSQRMWFYALVILMVSLTAAAGVWQWQRAGEKQRLRLLETQMAGRPMVTAGQASLINYETVQILGRTGTPLFWDNRTHKGRAGYEILVPVTLANKQTALVNLGFIAGPVTRDQLPAVPALPEFANWPTQVRQIDINWLKTQIRTDAVPAWTNSLPVLFELLPGQPQSLTPNRIDNRLGPERHLGYAFQWFAMSVVLLLMGIHFWRRQRNGEAHHDSQ